MPLIVPDIGEVSMLQMILTPALTIKLYSNNVAPSALSVAGDFTEVVGGGYVNKPLTFANWTFVSNAPSYAQYLVQSWLFTGVTAATGIIYGYFITRNSDGVLLWAERFAASVTPSAGTLIQLTPKLTGSSVF
jgi:hypothetical protein